MRTKKFHPLTRGRGKSPKRPPVPLNLFNIMMTDKDGKEISCWEFYKKQMKLEAEQTDVLIAAFDL